METLCFLIAFLLLQPCHGQTQSKSTIRSDLKNHALAESMDINVLIGKSVKVNPQKNPFLKINNNGSTQDCESIEDKRAHLNCVLNSFPEYKPPIEVGPIPEPKHDAIDCIDDSIFITNSLNDQNYFKTPTGDRTYCHLFGIIVDRNENYILCIIPYTDCCSYRYHLYSFNHSGDMIDKISMGAILSDISETYGFLTKKNKFELITNEFGFKDGKAYISQTKDIKYKISKTGKFKEQ